MSCKAAQGSGEGSRLEVAAVSAAADEEAASFGLVWIGAHPVRGNPHLLRSAFYFVAALSVGLSLLNDAVFAAGQNHGLALNRPGRQQLRPTRGRPT